MRFFIPFLPLIDGIFEHNSEHLSRIKKKEMKFLIRFFYQRIIFASRSQMTNFLCEQRSNQKLIKISRKEFNYEHKWWN